MDTSIQWGLPLIWYLNLD